MKFYTFSAFLKWGRFFFEKGTVPISKKCIFYFYIGKTYTKGEKR